MTHSFNVEKNQPRWRIHLSHQSGSDELDERTFSIIFSINMQNILNVKYKTLMIKNSKKVTYGQAHEAVQLNDLLLTAVLYFHHHSREDIFSN